MERSKTAAVLTILDEKKSLNFEEEHAKAMQEQVALIEKFEKEYIFEESNGKYKSNIKIKNYVDGSKYEG